MKRYSDAKVVVLAASLFSEGGDWRSIYFLIKKLEAKGEPVVMVHVGGKRGFRQMWAAAVHAPRLLVNGLGTLTQWPVLLICLWRSDVRIYLHETAYILDQFKNSSPLKYRIASRILQRNPLLCVSEQSEAHYRKRFNSRNTHVVYECPGVDNSPALNPIKKHIVMVGSINERKGAELFSQVADLAHEQEYQWQFHWVGSIATVNKIYQSSNVIWHGWLWNPLDLVRKCDLFFLSSVDDPCPLAAIEALHLGKSCVAYKETGTAELVVDRPGCRVFEEYNSETALQSLKDCFKEHVNSNATSAGSALYATTPKGFEERFLNAIKQDPIY